MDEAFQVKEEFVSEDLKWPSLVHTFSNYDDHFLIGEKYNRCRQIDYEVEIDT